MPPAEQQVKFLLDDAAVLRVFFHQLRGEGKAAVVIGVKHLAPGIQPFRPLLNQRIILNGGDSPAEAAVGNPRQQFGLFRCDMIPVDKTFLDGFNGNRQEFQSADSGKRW